jgi:excisionase family DNA binding protein
MIRNYQDLLTVREACARLKVSRVTLHSWTSAGLIQKIKLGRSVRYSESDIAKLIEDARVAA